jgi:hypothetical protein
MIEKVWETPKLTVIVRSRPEESVLGWCKANNIDQQGPQGTLNAGCNIGYCSGSQDLECRCFPEGSLT